MNAGLLARLESTFLPRSLTGAVSASSPAFSRMGKYLFASAPSVPALWQAFAEALRTSSVLVVNGPLSAAAEEILRAQLPAEPPSQACLALFTSGSTGQPKAVFHSAASLEASAAQLARAFGHHPAIFSALPPWGMAGIAFHFLLPLCAGTKAFFHEGPFLELAPRLSALAEAQKISFASMNPLLLEMLVRSTPSLPAGFELLTLTAPLSSELRASAEKLARVTEVYGFTEAAGPVLREGISLGAELRLAESGELAIRGSQLFLGYAQAGAFELAPDWFATGDLFVAQNERLVWNARTRELIDCGGRKVAPRLIEEIFLRLPEIKECLALPVTLQGCERPGLVYVRAKECRMPEAALAEKIGEWARTSLSLDMRPFVWRELGELPRLPNGKADKLSAKRIIADDSRAYTSRA